MIKWIREFNEAKENYANRRRLTPSPPHVVPTMPIFVIIIPHSNSVLKIENRSRYTYFTTLPPISLYNSSSFLHASGSDGPS